MRLFNRGSPDYGSSNSPQQDDYARRRGSRGSPSWDGGKRKRSTSPPDRYVKPRYEDQGYYGRSRYSQGRAHSPDRRGSRNEPQDPLTKDALVSFRQYTDWFKQAHPDEWRAGNSEDPSEEPEGRSTEKTGETLLRGRYDEYRRSFIRKQYKYMFDYHRKFAWFIEKYDMAERYFDMRERVRQQGWKGTIDQFIIQLEAGKFDPPLPGGEPSASITHTRGDEEDTEMNDQPTSQAAKKPASGEHMVAPNHPQLMIRTSPPDIGRLSLEELLVTLSGFKYVAIGDPVQKRQFYRSAWVAFEFEEDIKKAITELESKKIQNFRLPVVQTSEPFTARIRYTPPAANKLARMEKDLDQAKRLAAVLEARAVEVANYKPLFPVGAPLEQAGKDEAADEDPLKAESNEMDQSGQEDLDASRGSKAVESRIDKIASETLDTDENGNPDREKHVALSLDTYLAYLREAFHCCYYCGVVADHAEELVRKCIKHERQEASSSNSQENHGKTKESSNGNGQEYAEDRWGDSLDHKLACLLDPAGVDPAEYGGTKLEDERETMAAPHVTKEDEGKWRCQACKKLFKAQEFVEKHVLNKHPELVKSEMDEWELFNNFILDPQHIMPMQSLPHPIAGSSTQHPPQAFGLPPDWRPPYSESSRYDRGGREPYDRDRRPAYSSRNARPMPSPSPVQVNKPIHFTVDAETSSITINGDSRFVNSMSLPSSLPAVSGLPAKPIQAIPSSSSSVNSSTLLERMRPPPPPPGHKPDPRSRVSYQDLDQVDSSDDIALQY